MTELLSNVSQPETSIPFMRLNSIKDLILSDLNEYYTYHGSLTTPPCSEVVTWIDFKQPIPLSHAQVASCLAHHLITYKSDTKIENVLDLNVKYREKNFHTRLNDSKQSVMRC